MQNYAIFTKQKNLVINNQKKICTKQTILVIKKRDHGSLFYNDYLYTK